MVRSLCSYSKPHGSAVHESCTKCPRGTEEKSEMSTHHSQGIHRQVHSTATMEKVKQWTLWTQKFERLLQMEKNAWKMHLITPLHFIWCVYFGHKVQFLLKYFKYIWLFEYIRFLYFSLFPASSWCSCSPFQTVVLWAHLIAPLAFAWIIDYNTTCCGPFYFSIIKLDHHGLPAINFHLLHTKAICSIKCVLFV